LHALAGEFPTARQPSAGAHQERALAGASTDASRSKRLARPHSINSRLLSQFADVVPDYIMGSKGTAALYISLRYHLLNPTYLLGRLKELQNA
jgi:Binding domain of DNA repair protein Ercc1 (rad10/Swi10)